MGFGHATATTFVIVGLVLLFGRLWEFGVPKPDPASIPSERDWRRYAQRKAVFRSAGISLLIIGLISWLTT